ncbi:TetR/AcrR family transcriptional regulator [Rhodobacteraceae bacterium]|nr:TetR/AcrR family transcriptional regulator [Paracoccaceae bacterium]
MPSVSPRIRRGRKYDQVIDGARKVFLRDGYEGASVDDIAREAGVSKATLYSYVPDKRLLFSEVTQNECARQALESISRIEAMTAPPEDVLRFVAEHIMRHVTSDFGRDIYRICVAEIERFPDLGAQFYASGPMMLRRCIAAYLQRATERGELVVEDYEFAAEQFADLCKVHVHCKIIFGVEALTDADQERTIAGAIEMFMARYGAKA